MSSRYAAIYFPYLITDWITLRKPSLRNVPFVCAVSSHGRKVITAVNPVAEGQGISVGMVVADARVFVPGLQVVDHREGLDLKLLEAIGFWLIRYTPVVSVDPPGGLLLNVTGCAHLWGGEKAYLKEMQERLQGKGYRVRIAIADTPGAAWAVARFGKADPLVQPGKQREAILPLPPAALRLQAETLELLQKLGLYRVEDLIQIPFTALRKRFGENLQTRLRQALGEEEEFLFPLQPVAPYEERLPCLEPVRTAAGIETALRQLLEQLCRRLSEEGKGLRKAELVCYRVDGKSQKIKTGTNRPSSHVEHLFNLFELQISQIRPGLGIELFLLRAERIEPVTRLQESCWAGNPGLADENLSELLDRLTGKADTCTIRRYFPAEHYWPERSVREAPLNNRKPPIPWQEGIRRPIHLLPRPEPIKVSAPIPDYPPMLFHYKGKVRKITKADGPERIAHEWWLEQAELRDYYCVEDEQGRRYWLFRSGHYANSQTPGWFIHGFFA